jgi:TonB family protein
MVRNVLTNQLRAAADSSQGQTVPAARSGATECATPQDTRSTNGNQAADIGRYEELVLNKVLEEACHITAATGAAIALVQEAEMVCCATTGPNAPELGTRLNPRAGLSGCCVQTRQLQRCSDTETEPRVNLEACRLLGIRSIVVLPLIDTDQLVGIFEIFSSQPDAFGQRDLDSLKILADRILECRRSREAADATGPRKDLAVDPLRAELLTREFFLDSAQRDNETRYHNRTAIRTAIQTATVIAVAMLLGWMLGRAAWNMAVNRAEGRISRPQEELPAALSSIVPNALSASSGVEKSTTALSETTSSSNNDMGALPTETTREGEIPALAAQISPTATNSYLLTRVEPEYPEEAKQQHIQGRVVLKVVVGTDGLVRDLLVNSGDPQLGAAAANAVRQWRFKPHNVQGRPVEFETWITVNFSLT